MDKLEGSHSVNMPSYHHVHLSEGTPLLPALPFTLAITAYIIAVIVTSRYYKPWPIIRTVSWTVGSLFAMTGVTGHLSQRAAGDFQAHMINHLLLGMLAPLLMVLAAPMTLVLRTLSIPSARRVSQALNSWPLRRLTHPAVTAFLHIGGLWLLYTTSLYTHLHDSSLLYFIVHAHMIVAGYLFTASILYIDPIRHRVSFVYRAAVLVIASACHGILSKHIYAHPPHGVALEQAEAAGMLMYYGGDVIDIVLVFILCCQWYRATKPRRSQNIIHYPAR
ncbi:membrane protein [Paenibacillus sp. CCS19]|uniref:cytochrome c oxidase assembly protein n=1 Tax=Paenibacillus sp. CCS19 TaxID=3158387 RepID=UPI00255E0DF7|nr:cytochrome c oxidase assembly protein [Paenibacillus cellulosilyticus]GMK39160.1 membrane protein [Paenibacillus cellulosilyticus]